MPDEHNPYAWTEAAMEPGARSVPVEAIDQGVQLKRIADSLETISDHLESIFDLINDCTGGDDYGRVFKVRDSS